MMPGSSHCSGEELCRQLLSDPQAQLKVEILSCGEGAVALVEPAVWGAACPLCRGGTTMLV